MKILMALEADFPPDQRVENEIEALVHSGHEVHIACISRKRELRIPVDLSYTIHKVYMPPLIYKSSVGALKFGLYHRFWIRFIKKIALTYSFDAIHIHDLPLARVGDYFRRKRGAKFILDLHENWPALLDISTHTKTFLGRILCSIPQWERYEVRYTRLADRVIVVVEEAKDRLKSLGINENRIAIVSNTLKTELFDFPPQEKLRDQTVLFYGGGINYHRGLQYVIGAMPELVREFPDLVFWIAGSGTYTETLKEQVQKLGLDNKVLFLGWQKQVDLLKKISQADYALIPHLRSPHTDATIPHKIFQYMYAGIPIISSDCLPLKRIIEETGSGIIYQNRSSDSFATSFRLLHRDKKWLRRIRTTGRDWVNRKYNWKIDSGILTGMYEELKQK